MTEHGIMSGSQLLREERINKRLTLYQEEHADETVS